MPNNDSPAVVKVSESGQGRYQQTIRTGRHTLIADEPASNGGNDAGPTPHDFLLASLGACTSITLRMYAERKKWPLSQIHVELSHEMVDVAGRGRVERILRSITLRGALTAEQRDRLLEIANKCPMYRTLSSESLIVSNLTGSEGVT